MLENKMKFITACIDGSAITPSVCDAANWASCVLAAPLRLLHVLEKDSTMSNDDLSGAIGLDSREQLLNELTELDQKRAKLAMEHGKNLLEDAKTRAQQQGVSSIEKVQRHGSFIEAIKNYEEDSRLLVIGRLGEDHDLESNTIGSQLESMVRIATRPILVTVGVFKSPENYMIAYDGSETADKAIERIATSPLLAKMKGYVVMIAENNPDNLKHLEMASKILVDHGHDVSCQLIQGNVIEQLEHFQQQHSIDLKVMGAYGHSRFREFFVGSNTSKMIARSAVPILLLR